MTFDSTPLEKALAAPERHKRATPLDAFALARKMWLRGQRINLSAICQELGIGRATLSRWIGNKERLLGEILWSLYEPIFLKAKQETPGVGAEYVAGVYRRVMQTVLDAKPLTTFVGRDPHYALSILTASRTVQERRLQACRALLAEQVALGHLSPPLDLDTTAFVLTRLNESFVYSDALVGAPPSVDKAVAAIRVLLGDTPPSSAQAVR